MAERIWIDDRNSVIGYNLLEFRRTLVVVVLFCLGGGVGESFSCILLFLETEENQLPGFPNPIPVF